MVKKAADPASDPQPYPCSLTCNFSLIHIQRAVFLTDIAELVASFIPYCSSA